MSEFLFQHSRLGPRAVRWRLFGVGVLTALALVAVTGFLGGSYIGVLTSDLRLQARLTTSGDSLGVGSDVKFRGLRVGRVLSVEQGTEPVAEIVLMDEHVDHVPGDVVARVLPSTLFGNEFIDLVSAGAGGGELTEGQVILPDESTETLRLMDTFSATQRLLVAVDPARLDLAISEIAGALSRRGEAMADLVRDSDALLREWQVHEETFYEDLRLVARNVDLFADVEPGLVTMLRDSLPVARTIAEEERTWSGIVRSGTDLVADVNRFTARHLGTAATVLDGAARTLEVFARRHPAFESLLSKLPPVLQNGADAIRGRAIQMDAAMGLQFPDAYGPEDCPRYGHLRGKNCRD